MRWKRKRRKGWGGRATRSAHLAAALSALGQPLGNAPPVFMRHATAAAQGFERHVEREHLHLNTAARGRVGHAVQLVLKPAQCAQLFDGWRDKTRVLENTIGDAHFLRHEEIVVQGEGRACAGKIVEFAARGGFVDPLFDQSI